MSDPAPPGASSFTRQVFGRTDTGEVLEEALEYFIYFLYGKLGHRLGKEDLGVFCFWAASGLASGVWNPEHPFSQDPRCLKAIRAYLLEFVGIPPPTEGSDTWPLEQWSVERLNRAAQDVRDTREDKYLDIVRRYGEDAVPLAQEIIRLVMPGHHYRTHPLSLPSPKTTTPKSESDDWWPGQESLMDTDAAVPRGLTPPLGEMIEIRTHPDILNGTFPRELDTSDHLASRLFPPGHPEPAIEDGEFAPFGAPMASEGAVRPTAVDVAAVPEELGVGDPELASAQDFRQDHWYYGQQQPPVGVRLRNALNFLADEDVDRCMYWDQRFRDVKEYLAFLNDEPQKRNLGEKTKQMLQDALDRVKVHEKYEDYHYNSFVEYKPFDPETVPKPKPYLEADPSYPVEFVGRDRAKDRVLVHRPPDKVNKQWAGDAELGARRAQHLDQLAADEEKWWTARDTVPDESSNLSFLESQTYRRCLVQNTGWTQTSAQGGIVTLPDGSLADGSQESFARERGARRAGFQTVLRSMTNEVNRLADSPWRRVTLPNSPELLRQVREEAEGPSGNVIPVKTLEIAKLPKVGLDPQVFTSWMAAYWRVNDYYRKQARDSVMEEHKDDPRWVTPPMSERGAYVFRGLTPQEQKDQDLYKRLEALWRLNERANKVAPRPFIQDFYRYYDMARSYLSGAPPQELAFRETDWVTIQDWVDREKTIVVLRDIDEEDVQWIEFVLRNSIKECMGQKLYPRAKLFLTFYERLMRLMDDIGPEALWPKMESKVSVVQLLEVMNQGLGGPHTNNEVKKTKFLAYDVIMWLDRLDKLGRCKFFEDTASYGFVMRYDANVHPEHQLVWDPAKGEPAVRLSWSQAIQQRLHEQPTPPEIYNFFMTLAYRWGAYVKEYHRHRGRDRESLLDRSLMARALDVWETEFVDRANAEDVPTLMDVVSYADPTKRRSGMLHAEALALVRDGIIDECVRNETMLFPCRPKRYYAFEGERKVALVHPPLWEWAHRRVRGRRRQFFSVDRWPLELISEKARVRVASDQDLDQTTWLYDPCYEDPCPAKWFRERAKPHVEHVEQKVEYRWGRRVYRVGDTPLQRYAVDHWIRGKLNKDAFPPPEPTQPGLLGRVSGWFSRPPQPARLLPDVPEKLIPKSFDPAERARALKEAEDARLAAEQAANATAARGKTVTAQEDRSQARGQGEDMEMDEEPSLDDFAHHTGTLNLQARFRIA